MADYKWIETINDTLGAQHISDHKADFEVARSSFFTFIVDDLDNLVKANFSLEEPTTDDYVKYGKEAIALAVTKCDVPHFSINPVEIRRGNSVIKYAGTPTFKSGSLVVKDFVGIGVKDVLMAWQALAYNVWTDKGGYAKDYKKDCTLVEYDQAWNKLREWRLVGCFITDIGEDQFDIESTDTSRNISATISYDRAYLISSLED